MRKILWPIIALSLLVSCQTPPEYIVVNPDPAELPTLEEAISAELRARVMEPLDLVMEPQTVGDILHNMEEYQQGYLLMKSYSTALEEYVDDIITIHNNGGIKDGTHGNV